MPTPDEIVVNKEHLYESASLRDDLNDDEATVLLKWGEEQIERIAKDFPDEFEPKCRFLRQLLKNINRFVGQREFNELEGQQQYMSKVSMYLPPLGWESIDEEQLFSVLSEDKADMSSNLRAILGLLSPIGETPSEPTKIYSDDTPVSSPEESNITENEPPPLENPNLHSINQADITQNMEVEDWYGKEESE
jgi:hypothetical protein